jgi:hypothetical protein
MNGIMMVGLVILTRSFQRPAGMLRRVAKARSATLRNKNPANNRQGKGSRERAPRWRMRATCCGRRAACPATRAVAANRDDVSAERPIGRNDGWTKARH